MWCAFGTKAESEAALNRPGGYIREIYPEIETNHVTVYCENDAINLIFSAFSGREEDCGAPMKIQAAFLQNIAISECDLCVLLSNVLHACQKQKEKGHPEPLKSWHMRKKENFFCRLSIPVMMTFLLKTEFR